MGDSRDEAMSEIYDPAAEIESLRADLARAAEAADISHEKYNALRNESIDKDKRIEMMELEAAEGRTQMDRDEKRIEELEQHEGYVTLEGTVEMIAERERRIESLRAELANANDLLRFRNEEIDDAGRRIEELEREKRECEQMSEDIGGHPHGLDIITLDQIAKAREMASIWPDAPTPKDMKLLLKEAFNIHRCEGCEGMGTYQEIDRFEWVECPDCAEWGSMGFVIGSER